MSIGAITKVFATCPEEKAEYLVLIAMADQANDDGGNIWFNWSTIAHKARIDERTAQMVVEKLIAKGRVTVEAGGAPRGFDLYHIMFPSEPYTRDSFQKNREARRLEKRATGRTAYGRKRGAESSGETPNGASENFSDSIPGPKSEDFSGNSENFSEKDENFSVGTPLPRPPSAAEMPPETSLTRPLKRGVLDVVGEGVLPQPEYSSAPPNIEPPTPEGLRNLVMPLAPDECPPHFGGAAHAAAPDSPQKLRDETQPLTGQNDQTTDLEQIPGGGAGRAAAGVDTLSAVPMAELVARAPALPESAVYRALKALVGKTLPTYLGEKTRTGQLSRSLWLHLEEGEIGLVRVMAQAEAQATNENMITLAVRGLDRVIGAAKVERPQLSRAAEDADPQLKTGQRCMVADQVGTPTLGVVLEVNAARYKIRFDDGNGRDVDRTVAAQLRTLKASSAPLPVTPPEPEAPAPLVPAGTTWRRIKGKDGQPGEQVTVQAVLGMKRTLSNGAEVPVYVITRDFEQVI